MNDTQRETFHDMLKYFGIVAVVILSVFLVAFGVTRNSQRVAFGANSGVATVLVKINGGHGSGVYIGNGEIVTAAHVSADAKDGKVTIVASDGKEASATVVWLNKDADVSLLKLDMPFRDLKSADLACSLPDVQVGDEIEAIGNPINLLNVHTWGHVAAGVKKRSDGQVNFIGDITIAPGNSGGPVFSKDGNVAGITVAVAANMSNMLGVATPYMLTYVIPRSVICHELTVDHPAPTIAKENK